MLANTVLKHYFIKAGAVTVLAMRLRAMNIRSMGIRSMGIKSMGIGTVGQCKSVEFDIICVRVLHMRPMDIRVNEY